MFRGPIISILCMLPLLGGCYYPYRIKTEELTKLDGFVHGQQALLQGYGGTSVRFTGYSRLNIYFTNKEQIQLTCAAIEIEEGEIRIETGQGDSVTFRLDEIWIVWVENLNVRRTVVVSVAILVVGVVVLASI